MGRPLFSTVLTPPAVRVADPQTPTYQTWSHYNAFDPDSDEFFAGDDVVYEAFLTPAEIARTDPPPRPDSTDPPQQPSAERSDDLGTWETTFLTPRYPDLVEASGSDSSSSGRGSPANEPAEPGSQYEWWAPTEPSSAHSSAPDPAASQPRESPHDDTTSPAPESPSIFYAPLPLLQIPTSLRMPRMSDAQLRAFWTHLTSGIPPSQVRSPFEFLSVPSTSSPASTASPLENDSDILPVPATPRPGRARSPSAPVFVSPASTLLSPPPSVTPRFLSWADMGAPLTTSPSPASRMSLSHIAPNTLTVRGAAAAPLRVHQ